MPGKELEQELEAENMEEPHADWLVSSSLASFFIQPQPTNPGNSFTHIQLDPPACMSH